MAHDLKLTDAGTYTTYSYLMAAHVIVGVGALVLAVILRNPAVLVLGGPSLVVLLVTAVDYRVPSVSVGATIDYLRALEDDTLQITVEVASADPVPLVDVELIPTDRIGHTGQLRSVVSLPGGEPRRVDLAVVVHDWGVTSLGRLSVIARDRFGLVTTVATYRIETTIRVHIREEHARSLLEPDRFRRLVGSHLSANRGDGCEIADVRPYQPGDRLNAINWRISARTDDPWVTLRHPDRSTTVILIIDAFQELGSRQLDGFRRTLRLTLGLARLHLNAQDPVGLLIFGSGVRWIGPSLGPRQLHAMTDAVLELSTPGWGQRGLSSTRLDRRIPTDAVVVAVTPLHSDRMVALLTKLLARGQSVQVIEPFTDWRDAHPASPAGGGVGWRIFALGQEVRRRRLSHEGAAVIPWEEGQPVEVVLRGLRVHQRARRQAALR